MKPLSNVEVSLDKSLISATKPQARLLSYDRPPQQVDLVQNAGAFSVRIPELKLWTLVVVE